MPIWNVATISPEEGKRRHDANAFVVPSWGKKIVGWYTLFLFLILFLSACLEFWQLGRYGFSNLYYAAGVRSMLTSWHNFFFVSYDPGGFISLDKPPVDFWIQVLSAKVFGYSGFSLLLPQALAGVLSVALLAHLVRRRFGGLAGLLAALALTLTPISVITSRNNDVDSMLVLVILLAAWAVIIAAEQGSLRWLLLSMGIVGLGFNIKVAEAYLVVPAFAFLYFFTAPLRWRTRFWHLSLAMVVLLAVSLSWIIAVDLTPAAQRPYVGSSGNNTELRLAFGYNGVGRLLNRHPASASPTLQEGTTHPGGARLTPAAVIPSHTVVRHPNSVVTSPRNVNAAPSVSGSNVPGLTRLFNKQVAGQISWLLPLVLIGMMVFLWRKRAHLVEGKHFQGFVLWGGWFLTLAAYFSFVSGFQMYYMVMFAPAICALVGIGGATLWHEYTNVGIRGWSLPVALFITAAVQLYFLSSFPAWFNSWLTLVIVSVTSIAGLVLLLLRVWRRETFSPFSLPFMAAGLLVLMLAPAVWAFLPVIQGRNAAFPVAGPYGSTTPSQANLASQVAIYTPEKTLANNTLSITDLKLLNFLGAHESINTYLYVTTTSNYSMLAIIQLGRAVMTMGGFSGNDHILALNDAIGFVQRHVVRYFLLPGTIPPPLQDINKWVTFECTRVPVTAWYSSAVLPQDAHLARLMLYDCIDPHIVKINPVIHLHHAHFSHKKSFRR